VSLRPYPTLALFIVPVILLEPVKLVAAYLTAAGHIVGGLMILIAGELLKLLLIERLSSVSRDKLMTIPVFAGATTRFVKARTGWISAGMATHASGASVPSTHFKNMSSSSRLRESRRGFIGNRAERRARKPTSPLQFECHRPVVDVRNADMTPKRIPAPHNLHHQRARQTFYWEPIRR
jgi:hypothetical protein